MDSTDKSSIDRTRSASYQKYLQEMMNRMRQDAEKSNIPSSAVAKAQFTSAQTSDIVSVDFFEKANAIEHHTSKYSLVHNPNASLVIRRGQPFKMAITFLNSYKPEEQNVTLEFSFGHEPNRNKGSQALLEVKDRESFTRQPAHWDVKMDSVEGAQIKLQVQVPPTIGIGVWSLCVNMSPKNSRAVTKKHKIDKNIYILFNPWCKEDTVYMEKEDWRDEYVLNDVGKLYYGTIVEHASRRWVYGQFAVASLPASMYLLDLSGLLYNARSNPVRVVRAISNMMNKASAIPGDTGVLLGLWAKNSEEYRDGATPWSWTGSSPILEQFLKTNGTPVKYAQCWVFAGVTTAVCRAVGIPSRNTTAFAAGHDADETLTIDINYDSSGNRLKRATEDSIWNFHVWSEVWMTRLDLPVGYGGWQVIDGTPQEISDGAYQLGPCSVLGVKRGQVGLLYDTLFVFSEVNADMVNWALREDGLGVDKIAVNTDYIGQLVITKKVGQYDDRGDKDQEDITDSYKYKEHTPEERMAVLNAARNAGKSQLFEMPDPDKEEVAFELVPVKNVMVGDDFEMGLRIQNKSNDRHTISVVLCCCSVHYTGSIANKIKEEKKTVTVGPGKQMESETTWTVQASEYVDLLVEFEMIKIYCMSTVTTIKQVWAGEQDFVLNKPKLHLDLPKHLRVGQSYTLKVTLKNPFKKKLTECQFNAEGPGLIESNQRDFRDIQEQETVVQEFPVTPHYKCQTAVVAVFASKELSEITGSKQIKVTK